MCLGGATSTIGAARVAWTLGTRQAPGKQKPSGRWTRGLRGGAGGLRTPYLLHAMQALYQLSYSPVGRKS